MNYIREMNAFYDWLELNDVSASAINLWYALMHINNKAGWAKTFTVAESVLCVKTGLTSRTLRNVRNELKQKGRIDFTSRKGKAPQYSMIPFERSENNSEHFSEVVSGVSSEVVSEVPSALVKRNETETKDNNSSKQAREDNPHSFYQENFGMLSHFMSENITQWAEDLSDELVIAAMKVALKNNVRNFNYCEGILKDWEAKGITSVEDARAEQRSLQSKKPKSNNVTPIKRREQEPEQQYDYGF